VTRAPWPGLRPAWVEVDLDAIAGNVRTLADEVAPLLAELDIPPVTVPPVLPEPVSRLFRSTPVPGTTTPEPNPK
jgi:hypothetical protein